MSPSAVSADLRAILDLLALLPARAVDQADHPDWPGGDALTAIAPVANLEAYANRLAADERRGDYSRATYDDDDELWPIYHRLRFWSEQWRTDLGMDYDDLRPDINTEARFLAHPDVLAWACSNEPHFDDFALDIKRARRDLEDIARAGERADRIRVRCPDCETTLADEVTEVGQEPTKPPRLIAAPGITEELDRWKCPRCRRRYNADDVARARDSQMRSLDARRWVRWDDAAALLRPLGINERTLARWLRAGLIRERLAPTGWRQVWWPDVWLCRLDHRAAAETRARKKTDLDARKKMCLENHRPGCWDHDGARPPGVRGCMTAAREATA